MIKERFEFLKDHGWNSILDQKFKSEQEGKKVLKEIAEYLVILEQRNLEQTNKKEIIEAFSKLFNREAQSSDVSKTVHHISSSEIDLKSILTYLSGFLGSSEIQNLLPSPIGKSDNQSPLPDAPTQKESQNAASKNEIDNDL